MAVAVARLTPSDAPRLIAAARAGEERAFVELTAPHRSALHAHCYRLLGSLHDADDAMQETLLRAWQGIDRFEPRAPVAAWLYRIATNVCLRMIEQRRRRPALVAAHLEPYPDAPLAYLVAPARGPDEVVEMREAIGLAFVAAMQLLPPRQTRRVGASRRARLVRAGGRRPVGRQRRRRQQPAPAGSDAPCS